MTISFLDFCRMRRECIIFLFSLTFIGYVAAQQNMPVQLIDPEDGLSQHSVLSIHQDKLGFIWIGTRDGLNLYDGNKITIYRNELENNSSILGNNINDISDASDGNNIWIAHNRGVSLFDRQSARFRNYLPGNTHNNEMRSIEVIGSDIWACGWTGMYRYDKTTDAFVHAKPNTDGTNVFTSSVSLVRKVPGRDELWIGATNRGLLRYDIGKKQVTYTPILDAEALSTRKARIEDILFHPNGKAYVATYEKGIYECDLNGKVLRQWTSQEVLHRVFGGNIRKLALSKAGKIWIGGFGGLAVLDPQNGLIERINMQYEAYRIEKPSIRSLLVDKNGSLWIGTYHEGLLLYDDYFSRFRTNYLADTRIRNSHNIASAFARKPGRLFVGTENGHLLEYDDNCRLLRETEIQNKQGFPVVIKSLYFDIASDALWIGSLRDGLFRMRNGKVVAEGLQHLGVINHITPSEQGKLWLLSDRANALNLYDTGSKRLIPFPAQRALEPLLSTSKGKHLIQLTGERFLLSSEGAGLMLIENRGAGTIKKVMSEASKINHVFEYQEQYCISTNGEGLFVLDKNFQVLKHYTTKDGLPSNIVYNVVFADNALWISCINGISRLSDKNGFPLPQINEKAYLQFYGPTDSMLVVGGKNGWVCFAPRNVYKNPFKPAIYISNIKINNRPLSSFKRFEHIDISHPEKLELRHGETALTVEFVGLNYLMPENNSYRYMMEGLSSEWRYTSRHGIAEYSGIPAGKYVLKVQASNNDGVWSDSLIEIPIVVRPPFWFSPQAIALYLFLLLLTLWLLWRNALKKAKWHHDLQIKELEKQRIDEQHKLKVKYFTDISHEIRTPLMLILSPIEELLEDEHLKPTQKRQVQNIRYHGRNLLQLVNQLLEINRIEMNKEVLNEVPVLLKNVLEKINSSFATLAARNGITWKADMSGLGEQALLLDKKKIEKVMLNLLSNAIKYTPEGGNVQFSVRATPDESDTYTLSIDVEDTGIGIDAEALPHLFERFYKVDTKDGTTGSGIGLSLVKTIVEELFGGKINVVSTLNQGSKFSVTIPAIQKAENASVSPVDYFEMPVELSMEIDAELQAIPVNDDTDKRYTVLLVEDNILLQHSLAEKLQLTFNVLRAVSAEEAADMLQEEDVDLVVSDIMLPGKSGKEFCADIKSNILTSHIAVVLLTAIQQEDTKLESLELGADDYLTKPVSYKELYLRITNILQRREQLKDLYLNRQPLAGKREVRFNKYDNRLLEQIDEEIGKNLDNDAYSIEDLSNAVALSRVHLFRKMKKLLGVSPSRYLRNFRLQKAREILLTEDIRVIELAYRVGFQDPNYFLKCFKEEYGVSPGQYAKNLNTETSAPVSEKKGLLNSSK